ncbi:MAG: GNAT family N-acetyltransferase [Pseudomonadota bacterium]
MTEAHLRPLIFEHPFSHVTPKRHLRNHLVHVRRLAHAEIGTFRDHLIRLDTQSRMNRFGNAVSDAFLASYAERVMAREGTVKACFIDGVCRAAGEAFLVEHQDYDAEAAFSVEKRWQGYGLGTLIFKRLIRTIRNKGGTRICVICMRHNMAMRRIAEKMGGEIRIMPDGVVAHIERPASSLWSISLEAIEDASFMLLDVPNSDDD